MIDPDDDDPDYGLGALEILVALATTTFAVLLLGGVLWALWAFAFGAHAAPPPNADGTLSAYYRGLTHPTTGVSCCDISDCRTVVSRGTAEDGYQALQEGVWQAVPAGAVIRGHTHPAGSAVLCGRGGVVFCFVPAEASR